MEYYIMSEDKKVAEGFIAVSMEVTSLNKATSKREPVGKIDIYVPTLASIGIKADPLIDTNKQPVFDDDGIPAYADDIHNFVQKSIYAQVKAQARNRLESGKAVLRSGMTIATDWASLTAELERQGGGAGLLIYRQCVEALGKWIDTLGKSASGKAIILGFFSNKNSLATQDKATKEKMLGYITDFASSLSPEQLTTYEKYITNVADICETDTDRADF
jgi:hypothetical protein